MVIPYNTTTMVDSGDSHKSKWKRLTKFLQGSYQARQRIPRRRVPRLQGSKPVLSRSSMWSQEGQICEWNTIQKQIVMLNKCPKLLVLSCWSTRVLEQQCRQSKDDRHKGNKAKGNQQGRNSNQTQKQAKPCFVFQHQQKSQIFIF